MIWEQRIVTKFAENYCISLTLALSTVVPSRGGTEPNRKAGRVVSFNTSLRLGFSMLLSFVWCRHDDGFFTAWAWWWMMSLLVLPSYQMPCTRERKVEKIFCGHATAQHQICYLHQICYFFWNRNSDKLTDICTFLLRYSTICPESYIFLSAVQNYVWDCKKREHNTTLDSSKVGWRRFWILCIRGMARHQSTCSSWLVWVRYTFFSRIMDADAFPCPSERIFDMNFTSGPSKVDVDDNKDHWVLQDAVLLGRKCQIYNDCMPYERSMRKKRCKIRIISCVRMIIYFWRLCSRF